MDIETAKAEIVGALDTMAKTLHNGEDVELRYLERLLKDRDGGELAALLAQVLHHAAVRDQAAVLLHGGAGAHNGSQGVGRGRGAGARVPSQAEPEAEEDERGVVRPVLLDLYSGAGGAAVGYSRAGFDVVGVDIKPQPNYPFEHHVADALEFVAEHGPEFDAIHASPPCQRFSDLAKRNGNAEDWPDLIEPTRALLKASNRHWVIENVEGAPLINPVMRCGATFPGLRVIRHRLFEASFWIPPRPCPPRHPLVFTHDKRKNHYGKLDQNTAFVQVTGGGNATVANKAAAMGIDWMTGKELNEAVPPMYTEDMSRFLLEARRLDIGSAA